MEFENFDDGDDGCPDAKHVIRCKPAFTPFV